MNSNTVLPLATKAENLSFLAVAVTEFEDSAPSAVAFSNITGFQMQQGLAILLRDNMKSLRAEIERQHLPGLSPETLSLASTSTATLAELAIEAEGDCAAFDEFTAYAYTATEAVRALAAELDELAQGRGCWAC